MAATSGVTLAAAMLLLVPLEGKERKDTAENKHSSVVMPGTGRREGREKINCLLGFAVK